MEVVVVPKNVAVKKFDGYTTVGQRPKVWTRGKKWK